MKKILIIEDEEAAARRLHKMVIAMLPDAEILPAISGIQSAVHWLKTNPPPHLIFMDIHLADGESFEICKQVNVTSPIIFTTAYDQYALEAFTVNSIDYLLKPIKKEALQRAIEKYLNLSGQPAASTLSLQHLISTMQQPVKQYKDRFAVRYGEHLRTIQTSEAAYFYTESKINFLITKEAKRFAIDYNLDQLEDLLNPKDFFRINRQFIVGLHAIAEMFTYSKSRVLIKLNPPTKLETIVSTERSASFKAWLDGA